MVRSSSSCVEPSQRLTTHLRPLFQKITGACPCGCGGLTFQGEGSTLTVCFLQRKGFRALIEQAPLVSTQKLLLHTLLDHCRDKDECWPGGPRLAMATGRTSRTTLCVHKKALRELGVLAWEERQIPGKRYPGALYRLNWRALQELVVESVRGEPIPRPPRSRRERPPAEEAPVAAPAVETEPEPAEAVLVLLPSEDEDGHGHGHGHEHADAHADEYANESEHANEHAEHANEYEHERADEHGGGLTPASTVLPALEDDRLPGAHSLADEGASVTPVQVASPELPDSAASPRPEAPFRLPFALLWSLWTEAYLRAYGLPYLRTRADLAVVPVLAAAAVTAVRHLEARSGEPWSFALRLQEASAFLRHIFDAFLRLPGSHDFLREQRHPLRLVPGDLNRLSATWSRLRQGSAVAPAAKAVPEKAREEKEEPAVLSAKEQKERARALLAKLGRPVPGAPRPRPTGRG